MTDNLRDEVRAKLFSASLAGWKTAMSGGSPVTEEDLREDADSITNLVLGVKELEWGSIGEEVWFSQNGLGGTYQIEFDEQRQKYRAMFNTAGETLSVGVADTLEVAKAACQADYANRIQSALTAKPAPVVSKDMLDAIHTLRSALNAIRKGYSHIDTNHADFRLQAFEIAQDAIAVTARYADLPTLEAACQADFAKPAPVVSDESGAFKAFQDAAHELAGYADNLIERCLGTDKERIAPEWDTLFFGFAKANEGLTTSLTEADIRADAQRIALDAITVDKFGSDATLIREQIRSAYLSQGEG